MTNAYQVYTAARQLLEGYAAAMQPLCRREGLAPNGVDILLFGNNLYWDETLPDKAFETLRGLVESGRISRQRIMESWLRITNLYASRATAARAAADGSLALYPWTR